MSANNTAPLVDIRGVHKAFGGVQAVTQHLVRHFPAGDRRGNELPDQPVLL